MFCSLGTVTSRRVLKHGVDAFLEDFLHDIHDHVRILIDCHCVFRHFAADVLGKLHGPVEDFLAQCQVGDLVATLFCELAFELDRQTERREAFEEILEYRLGKFNALFRSDADSLGFLVDASDNIRANTDTARTTPVQEELVGDPALLIFREHVLCPSHTQRRNSPSLVFRVFPEDTDTLAISLYLSTEKPTK